MIDLKDDAWEAAVAAYLSAGVGCEEHRLRLSKASSVLLSSGGAGDEVGDGVLKPFFTASKREASYYSVCSLVAQQELGAFGMQCRPGESQAPPLAPLALEARERMDFEARLGRDLARLARSSRPSRSALFEAVRPPRPAADAWAAAPRGFALGGVRSPRAGSEIHVDVCMVDMRYTNIYIYTHV